jgi:biopolymer transport protein ExbD
MTPLIDVSLVLVVMLLLATPLAFESSIDVKNAAQAARKAQKNEKDPRVELVLVSEDSVRVNRAIVSRADLSVTLKPLIDNAEERGVVISCNNGVTHGAFVDVLDQAKKSGANDIAVVER